MIRRIAAVATLMLGIAVPVDLHAEVLVHCQINLRASSFTFLYRVLSLGEPPRVAYEAPSSVWVPHGPWRRLIDTELRNHHIDFELL